MPSAISIITLLTDFGTRDYFVASMKGVILNINSQARIVDLSHDVGPQQIEEAAYLLKSSYRYFPDGTVHVAVVDPGVGTARRPLLVTTSRYHFIAPDNGLLTYIFEEELNVEVRDIENKQYRLDSEGASVATDDGARSIVDSALEAFGDLDIVVNNAGSVRPGAFIGLSQEDFEDVVSVHLTGTFNVSRHAAVHWARERDRGVVRSRSLIHTSSSAGLHGRPVGHISYAAAKAGVAAMTQVMAVELKDVGVRVNCIVPMARTRLTAGLPGMDDHLFEPRHIAPLAACLARADCTFSGQVFSIFGGSVGLYAGWSIAHEERSAEGWTVASLHEAMQALPLRVKVNTQAQLFAELTGQ